MSDNKSSILPDAIEPISNAIHQNLPETEKQADGALSAVVGFFNHVVLYPVKKANLTFRYKLKYLARTISEMKLFGREQMHTATVSKAPCIMGGCTM